MTTSDKATLQTEELKNQIKQQEKLASLGLLTAGIMHEIKNPLNFIINFSRLSEGLLADLDDILSEYADKISQEDREELDDIVGDLKENVSKILEHGQRASSIARNILQFSRGKEGELIPTDICQLVHEYVWLGYHAMRANYNGFNTSVSEHYADGMKPQKVVPQDISRAVLNVANNAFYAVWERSHSDDSSYKPEIDINVSCDGEYFSVTIADNGMGMSDEVKAKLYDNFFTTKPAGHGTGLGMAITRGIVEQHGGKISFESSKGQGTRFTLTFPAGK